MDLDKQVVNLSPTMTGVIDDLLWVFPSLHLPLGSDSVGPGVGENRVHVGLFSAVNL